MPDAPPDLRDSLSSDEWLQIKKKSWDELCYRQHDSKIRVTGTLGRRVPVFCYKLPPILVILERQHFHVVYPAP